ncbi:MAG: ABC transporter ATP-binding protein [Phycisphaerae bacterium]|nr:ABC transporter ATP-binding protein [Phycisphaerae bacterium]
MRIEAEGLCVRRGKRPILHDVSLVAEPGETIAVVGPNGAGKTTLLLSLLGLLPRQTGRITLDAVPIEKLSRRRIARHVAYVPQLYEGFLGFRVRDIIAAGRYAHVDPLDPLGGNDRKAIDAAIERCDVRGLLDRTAETLSGGERQKVWLAAALAQESPALFLDEPTNSLDPKHQAELIRLLRELAQAGKTLMVVCHDLNLPAMLDARVIALRDGRVAFDGAVETFLPPERLREIFDTEFVQLADAASGRTLVQLKV